MADRRGGTYKHAEKRAGVVTTLTGKMRRNARVWDTAAVLAVPVVLLWIGTLPIETRRAFVFSYRDPTVVTAYTAHFVHLTRSHLFVNLVSYLLVAPTGYALAVAAGRRDRWLTGFVTVLLAVPFALSWLNLAFVRPRVGYGFSGVTMGLVALVAVELFAFAGRHLTTPLGRENAAGVFFAEVALIAAVVRPRTQATLAIAGLAAVVTLGYAVAIGRLLRENGRVWTNRVHEPGYLELAGVGVVVLVGFPFLAFPADPTGDGTVLNLYTHLLGFALAFLTAYLSPVVENRVGQPT